MLTNWEPRFEAIVQHAMQPDAAHDLEHVRRVVTNARRLARAEGADLRIVLPAAWLHDCVAVPKDAPERSKASHLAAETATTWLRDAGYPPEHLPAIAHAIEAHSFSAGIAPQTLEAQVVQDADRLDALGAVGIARTFMVGGALGSRLYDPAEPHPTTRTPDDRRYVVDHFYAKLLHLAGQMQTASGRAEATRRTAFMRAYLDTLYREIAGELDPPDA